MEISIFIPLLVTVQCPFKWSSDRNLEVCSFHSFVFCSVFPGKGQREAFKWSMEACCFPSFTCHNQFTFGNLHLTHVSIRISCLYLLWSVLFQKKVEKKPLFDLWRYSYPVTLLGLSSVLSRECRTWPFIWSFHFFHSLIFHTNYPFLGKLNRKTDAFVLILVQSISFLGKIEGKLIFDSQGRQFPKLHLTYTMSFLGKIKRKSSFD